MRRTQNYAVLLRKPARLFFFGGDFLFDFHVAELARLEDLTAYKAFHVLGVFVARNHLDFGVPAGIIHWVALEVDVSPFCPADLP